MSGEGWFLYLLRCADGSLYTGVTTDLERRVKEHNRGQGSRYTAGRRPVWPIGVWQLPDRSSAQQAEAHLRRLSRAKKEWLALDGQPFEGAAYCGPVPHRFCPRCGGALETLLPPGAEHPRQTCTACGRPYFRNSKPCAGALVVKGGRVLLVRRAIQPYKGYWDIPGGFLEHGEHPETGAIREVLEETGLEIRLTGLLGFYMDRYSYQDEGTVCLNSYFLAQVVGGQEQAGDDAAEIGWFGSHELPARIAFDHARLVLADWVRQVTEG